jgi:hypothetical protein
VRVSFALAILGPLHGCAFLNDSLNAAPAVDPNRIYLRPNEVVAVQHEDIGRYACLGVPMICRQSGISYDCRCP